MAGILVQLLLSWLLVWWVEKGNLSFMGFFPTKKRIADFILFLLLTAGCCALGFILRWWFAGERWLLNPQLSWPLIAEGIWWNIKSVLFEEFIFRGVLLYLLIKKAGHRPAIIITAIGFGIYHWFSHELWGQPLQMFITFLVTGCMGLVLAYAYYKTTSLYVPIAIHLGWGVVQQVVFSTGPIGGQLLVLAPGTQGATVSYLQFYLILLLPVGSALLLNYLILRRRKGMW